MPGKQRNLAEDIRQTRHEHPEWTPDQIAAHVRCVPRRVYQVLADDKRRGIIPAVGAQAPAYAPDPTARPPARRVRDAEDPLSPEALALVQAKLQEAEQAAGHVLTGAERTQILTEIARDPDAGRQAQIAAVRELRKEDVSGQETRLGPGPPLTDADKVERVALLLEACGKTLAQDAWSKAFPG